MGQAEAIKAYFELRKDKILFFKSLESPSSGSTLSGLIDYTELNGSHDINEKKFGVEFEKIFNEKEMGNLKRKAHTMSVIKFDKR